MELPIEQADILGYGAALLVFITFCMKSMIWLRAVAVGSNIAFIAYGLSANLSPILTLHLILLPMNIFRFWENFVLAGHIRRVTKENPSAQVLLPFMRPVKIGDGGIVFRKGEEADRLFYLQQGKILIEEFGKFIEAGGIFGEIGLFACGQSRIATARVIGDVELFEIDRDTVIRICQEHPEFSLTMARLVTDRLIENQASLVKRLSDVTSGRAR